MLTLRGVKSANMGLEIATRFDAMAPVCRDMFATDTGDANNVYKPGAGARGNCSSSIIWRKGKKEATRCASPLQVAPPECRWRLAELEVKARNSFSAGAPARKFRLVHPFDGVLEAFPAPTLGGDFKS